MIFGIGTGLFILLGLWVTAALIFIISLRVESKIGGLAIFVVSLITAVLVLFPRASERRGISEHKPYDKIFVWRLILCIFLFISTLVGLASIVKFQLLAERRARRIIGWLYTYSHEDTVTIFKMLQNISKIMPVLARRVSMYHRNNKKFDITNNSDFVDKVMNGSVPVIVNFHAEWCEPCKILTPKLIELIEPMENLHLAIINVEDTPDFVHTFEVKAVPAVIAISKGLVVDKFIGLVNTEMIETLIQKLTNEGQLNAQSSEKTNNTTV